jgi:hypothetical protein
LTFAGRTLAALGIAGLSFSAGMWAERQLHPSVEGPRERVVAAPQVRAPDPVANVATVNAISPEPAPERLEGSVRLDEPAVLELVQSRTGFRRGDVLSTRTELEGFLGGETQELIYAWSVDDPRPIAFVLRDGRSYWVDSSDCPPILTQAGECTVRITMHAYGPGRFDDTLDVTSGQERLATVELQGLDQRPATTYAYFEFETDSLWQTLEREARQEVPSVEAEFWLVNIGDAPGQIHSVSTSSLAVLENTWRKVGGSCEARTVMPGQACSVRFLFEANTSVPFTTAFARGRFADRVDRTKHAMVSVHIVGLHPDLPDVLQVGDACLQPRTREEVISTPVHRWGGEARTRPLDVETVTCLWDADADEGTLTCDRRRNPDASGPTATISRYAFEDTLWRRVRVAPTATTPMIYCAGGLIEHVLPRGS